MRKSQDGYSPHDFVLLHNKLRPKLERLAEHWVGGGTDDADEAVQTTVLFAWSNLTRIPSNPSAAERCLITILKFAVRKVRAQRYGHHVRPRAKSRLSLGVSTDAGETTEHSLAVAAAIASPRTDDGWQDVLDPLTRRQRELLFGTARSDRDAWDLRKRQASLRVRLQRSVGGPVLPSPETRVMEFVEIYADMRGLSGRDYLSAYRVLEHRAGRWLRLHDLDNAFFERYVASLSRSSRKRVLAIWNAAASIGIVEPPPVLRRHVPPPHPIHWSEAQLLKVVGAAKQMQGCVGRTRIPKNEYWPAIISLAADSGLSFVDLLEMTWDSLRENERIKVRSKPATIDYLRQLQSYGRSQVFPWIGARARFYKYYGSVVREGGLSPHLTPRERDVLHGTAAGESEESLAGQFDCCLGNIRKYRQRLREKLNIRGTRSIQALVLTAEERGLLANKHCSN